MTDALRNAIQYLQRQRVDIPMDIYLPALKLGAIQAKGNLSAVNKAYHDAITSSLTTYFEGGSTSTKNAFRRAMVEAFGEAVDLGWKDGGQEPPLDDELLDWFNARVNAEQGFIDELFQQARQLRKEADFDYFTWITSRADTYTQAVASVYNAAVMFAQKNKMLVWHLGKTEKHCDTCLSLDGGRHKASWYIARDYIPRKPGAAMDCAGYNCDCSLTDDTGKAVTI